MRRGKVVKILLLPALAVVALDQASKLAVLRALSPYESIPVIHGFFNLVHVRNRGIAFGLLSSLGATWGTLLLSATTVAAIVLLLLWVGRLRARDERTAFGLALIIGGALGNLIDRIRLGEVVDFLDFYLRSFHWPAFNVADSAVTVGTFWVLWCMVFTSRSEGNEERESRRVS